MNGQFAWILTVSGFGPRARASIQSSSDITPMHSFARTATLMGALGSIFPIFWAITEGASYVGPTVTTTLYGILDLSTLLIITHFAVSISKEIALPPNGDFQPAPEESSGVNEKDVPVRGRSLSSSRYHGSFDNEEQMTAVSDIPVSELEDRSNVAELPGDVSYASNSQSAAEATVDGQSNAGVLPSDGFNSSNNRSMQDIAAAATIGAAAGATSYKSWESERQPDTLNNAEPVSAFENDLIDHKPAENAKLDTSKMYDDDHFNAKDISVDRTVNSGSSADAVTPLADRAAVRSPGLVRFGSTKNSSANEGHEGDSAAGGVSHELSEQEDLGVNSSTKSDKGGKQNNIKAAIMSAVGAGGYNGKKSVLNENEVIKGRARSGTALSQSADDELSPADATCGDVGQTTTANHTARMAGTRAADKVGDIDAPDDGKTAKFSDNDVNMCTYVPASSLGESKKGAVPRGTVQGRTHEQSTKLNVDSKEVTTSAHEPATTGTAAALGVAGVGASKTSNSAIQKESAGEIQSAQEASAASQSDSIVPSQNAAGAQPARGGDASEVSTQKGISSPAQLQSTHRKVIRTTAGRYIDPDASVTENMFREPSSYGGPMATEVNPDEVSDSDLGITGDLAQHFASGKGDQSMGDGREEGKSSITQKILAPLGLSKKSRQIRQQKKQQKQSQQQKNSANDKSSEVSSGIMDGQEQNEAYTSTSNYTYGDHENLQPVEVKGTDGQPRSMPPATEVVREANIKPTKAREREYASEIGKQGEEAIAE